MKNLQFPRSYFAYAFAYLTYRISLYTLNKLFNMVDEIIDSDTNALSDSINDISTTHDYETCKEVTNIISVRGGQNGLLARGEVGLISKSFASITTFNNKVISIILRPIANILGHLLIKIPALKRIYDVVKTVKIMVASFVAIGSMRVIARFDYWSLIISGSMPTLNIADKSILSSIRRMRMGIPQMVICIPQSHDIINLVSDEEANIVEKSKLLIDIFSMYEHLPENHFFKNSYFACIIHILLTLFITSKMGFNLTLRILLQLVKANKISLETYREILSQLVAGGVSPIELDIL